eukprot:Phypoly_transcript_18586.p1 GENE.Phypoly_transcript_18586~~Phypoly_transcript_18586.p1  ORF type:complete len:217 (+),score=18.06 Phypoly_transcript_18586:52-702(+)
MFHTFLSISSRGQRVLLFISLVSIIIGTIAIVVGVLFEKPPNSADPKWSDIYPFFAVFSYMAVGGGVLMLVSNVISVVALLCWFHTLFIVQIIFSCVNIFIGIICGVVSYVGGIVVHLACTSVEASCVPCYDTDLHTCDSVAASHGKGCFYDAKDFGVLCGDMQRKLILVGTCLTLGFVFSLIVSTMGCLTCKRMKHRYVPVQPVTEMIEQGMQIN